MGKMKDVMIDLETFGKQSYCVVPQIGGCYFDRETGEIGNEFKMHIDAASEVGRGFKFDADTLYWWFSQSKEAQNSALGRKEDRKHSKNVWSAFNTFLRDAECIWMHATFDGPIVNEHLRIWGITPTFKYWVMKDLRTLTEMAGIDTRKYKRNSGGILHDALDDCKLQVKYTVDAMRKLKGGTK